MRLYSDVRSASVPTHSQLESFPQRTGPTLAVGDTAPGFALPDADMELFELSALAGQKHVVLYFYPRDNTPGCTLQAMDFSDHESDFTALDSVVVGISPDDCLTHAHFRDEHGLSVCLLSDEDLEICRLYGVWRTREVEGTHKTGVVRTTFIIDKHGIIRHIFNNVAPRGHVADVLHSVRKLEAEHLNGSHQKYRRHP
jgi:thioredoxin-dependent peroxiredoxin